MLLYGPGQRPGRELARFRPPPPCSRHCVGRTAAIPARAATPEPAEPVCCIDVLKHIEPEFPDDVPDAMTKQAVARAA